MGMSTEVKEVELNASNNPVVRNEIDDADMMSVSSVSPMDGKTGDIEELDSKENKEVDAPSPSDTTLEKKEESVVKEEGKESRPKETPKPTLNQEKVQKRIDELTRKRYDAERRAAEEQSRRVAMEVELRKLQTSSVVTSKPKIEDFEDETSYMEALVEWKTDVKLAKMKEQDILKARETSVREQGGAERAVVNTVIEKGKEKYSDYAAKVLSPDLILAPSIVSTVMASDKAEDILYYLGSNPDESKYISSLSGTRIAIELGKIEERLSRPVVAQPKKTTRAPEPIRPVNTGGASSKDPMSMTMKEYRAWREKQR